MCVIQSKKQPMETFGYNGNLVIYNVRRPINVGISTYLCGISGLAMFGAYHRCVYCTYAIHPSHLFCMHYPCTLSEESSSFPIL